VTTRPTGHSPDVRQASGLCPIHSGVIPAPVMAVQTRPCNSGIPSLQEGRQCPTGPVGHALSLVVVSLPLEADVPPTQGRQTLAVGPTLHSRVTAHKGTRGSGLPYWQDTPCASAQGHVPTTVATVTNRPQWPTTGRSPVVILPGKDSNLMTQPTGEGSASPATTEPQPATPGPEEGEPATPPDHPRGVTLPPPGKPDRQPGSMGCRQVVVTGRARDEPRSVTIGC
jgi:hypothetical protein